MRSVGFLVVCTLPVYIIGNRPGMLGIRLNTALHRREFDHN